MPDDKIKYSEAYQTARATQLHTTDILGIAQVDPDTETGYGSKGTDFDDMSKFFLKGIQFSSDLQTTSKTVIGAINEVNTKASQFDNMTATASGSIATFDNGGDDIPVSEFECEIVAQQGSGTPSPSDPLPITGFSQADIGDSSDATNSAYFKGLLEGKYGFVDLGTLSWSGLSRDRWNSTDLIGSVKTPLANSQVANIICSTLASQSADNVYLQNEGIAVQTTGDTTIYSTALVGKTSAQVQTALSGVYLIYELATPTTPTITEEQFASLCNAFGIIGNLYTVSFGQTIYGGRLIYANGQWSIEATFGYIEFDGSNDETWQMYSVTQGNLFRTQSSLKNYLITADNTLCNTYAPTDDRTDLTLSGSGANFDFINNSIANVAGWRTNLSNNPITVCFELETPTIIPITSATRVKTISGLNNIYSNTGDCEVKYFTNKADSLAELIKAFVL